jgi:hypothetical protein
MSLTLNEIMHAGEKFLIFSPVDRKYSDRYDGGFTQTTEQTVCYKGLDCIFFEKYQFLVLRWMNGKTAYCGYCCELDFFLKLCEGIAPGGIFNNYPLEENKEKYDIFNKEKNGRICGGGGSETGQ